MNINDIHLVHGIFSSFISLVIFYLSGLFINEKGVLTSPTIIVNLIIFSSSFVSFCFMYCKALLLCA